MKTQHINPNILKALIFITGTYLFFLVSCSVKQLERVQDVSSVTKIMESKTDVWGEAAIAQPNGPTYEFFEKLLPPPRYVNADFHYYPITLCAPFSQVKARLIANGSGVNLSGGTKAWKDIGTPFKFRVGTDEFLFGTISDRTSEPVLAEGWLPIPEICYFHKTPYQSEGIVPLTQTMNETTPEIYRLEAFASTEKVLSENGVVLVKFDLKQGSRGFVSIETNADLELKDGRLTDNHGNIYAFFDGNWIKEGKLIRAKLAQGTKATMAIATMPLNPGTSFFVKEGTYEIQRDLCVQTWKSLLSNSMQIETPEPLVNNMYRNSLSQIFQLVKDDEIRYSTGNQYEKLYEAEGSDAALALLLYGFDEEMKSAMLPLFRFTRKGLEYHQASFKINNLCQYYWQTRDKKIIEEYRPFWEKEAQLLDTGRTGVNGLYKPEQYCGDIHTFVQSVTVNTQAWKAMRDLGAVLSETGFTGQAIHYAEQAESFRKVVLAAINQAADRSTDPPFVPVALDGGEPVHDPIMHSRIGGYWNIIIGYAIRSGIFYPGSEEENWIPNYMEKHGGLFMGMVKSGGGEFNFWTGNQNINPLYGTRYTLDALRRDDPDRALVSFYGMLAQGLTRNTFVGGEGSPILPVDKNGRFFYLPPNSAASAFALSMLRNLLVQDWDLDDDGKPETLRLGFAVPKQWLEDGKTITVGNAPTAFGKVSYCMKSDLEKGKITVTFSPPSRAPAKMLLRIRVPDEWKIRSASEGSEKFKADQHGTIDITSLKKPCTITIDVRKKGL